MNFRLLAAVAAVVLYALLSHQLMLHAAETPWAVAALFGPLLLPGLALAWRRGNAWLVALVLAVVVGLVLVVASGGLGDVRRLYVAQHVGVHLALGLSFAATLRGPGLSLIGQLAWRVHGGRLPDDMRAYTAQVTRLWVVYFFVMAGLSLAIFATLSWSAWSLFANVLTPCAIAAVFVGEYLARYRLHPEFERVTLSAAVSAFQRRPPASERAVPPAA